MIRHQSVLAYMNLLHSRRAGESRSALARMAARFFGRGKYWISKLSRWERSWIEDRTIERGHQGRFAKTGAARWGPAAPDPEDGEGEDELNAEGEEEDGDDDDDRESDEAGNRGGGEGVGDMREGGESDVCDYDVLDLELDLELEDEYLQYLQ